MPSERTGHRDPKPGPTSCLAGVFAVLLTWIALVVVLSIRRVNDIDRGRSSTGRDRWVAGTRRFDGSGPVVLIDRPAERLSAGVMTGSKREPAIVALAPRG